MASTCPVCTDEFSHAKLPSDSPGTVSAELAGNIMQNRGGIPSKSYEVENCSESLQCIPRMHAVHLG